MKTLFDFYRGEGNVGGNATDAFKFVLRNHTTFKNGDKLVFKYVIVSTISEGTVAWTSSAGSLSATSLSEGTNLLEINYIQGQPDNPSTGGDLGRFHIRLSNSNEIVDTYLQGDPYQSDTNIKLTLQDTSESPADNTVVAKMGTVLFIPAS